MRQIITDDAAGTTSTTTPSNSSEDSSGSGLSAGAAAGVGVGVGVGVVVMSFAVWRMYLMRRSRRQAADPGAGEHSHETAEQMAPSGPKTVPSSRAELPENLPVAQELHAYPQ